MDVRNVQKIVKLRKGVFVTVSLIAFIVLGIAFVAAFQKKAATKKDFHETPETGAPKITESIASLPDDYSQVPLYDEQAQFEDESEHPVKYAPEMKPRQAVTAYENIPHHSGHSIHPTEAAPQSQGPDEEELARNSPLAFKISRRNLPDQNQTPSSGKTRTVDPNALTASLNQMAQVPLIESDANQNMQLEKRDFKKKKEDDDAVYVNHHLQKPVSPYQVMAGSIMPGVLLTGINSELPGQIIGQIRENVYDTVTGNYLLIPQGTKVIGRYDSVIAYGQERVLIVWNRLILPDGSSLLLDSMAGTDLGGYSGLKDKVNNHYLKLAAGVALSTLLSVGASVSSGTPGYNDDDNGYDVTNKFAENAGQSLNQAGQKIVGKTLNIQPTLEIGPGFTFNVMVNKDIVLSPYNG